MQERSFEMAKKFFLKAAAFLALFAGLAAGASAQVTISGGFALSTLQAEASSGSNTIDGEIGAGGNVYVDYLLPISIPLSIGVEVGVDSSTFNVSGNWKDTVLAIPLLLRAAYHFDLMPKLDLYAVGKIGVAFGNWSGDFYDYEKFWGGDIDTPFGVAFGIDVGAAYYFDPRIGLFAEAGFDDYNLKTKASFPDGSSETLKAPFYRFLTIGLSTKF
jgi:hypothetical protein